MLSIENTLIEPIALPNDRFKAVRLSFTKNNPNPKKIQYQPSNFPLSCPTALSVWLFSFAFCKMRKVNQSCRIKFFLFFHSLSLLIGLRAGVPPPRRGKTDFHRHSSTNRAPSLPRNHSARTSQLYQVSPFNRNTQPKHQRQQQLLSFTGKNPSKANRLGNQRASPDPEKKLLR